MNQTAKRCLAALCMAAWAAGAPLHAVANETKPGPTHPAPAASDGLPASKMGKRETYPFRGVIAAVDATAHTVTLDGRTSRRVIAVIPETKVTRDGGPVGLADLKSGEAVGGTLRKTGDGREEALLIRTGLKPESKPGGKAKAKKGRTDTRKEDTNTQ